MFWSKMQRMQLARALVLAMMTYFSYLVEGLGSLTQGIEQTTLIICVIVV
jgi:hypothetical protein